MRISCIILLLSVLSSAPIYASTHQHMIKHEQPDENSIQLVIENAPTKITTNTTQTIHLQLLKNNKPLTLEDLKTVHTKRIHVMVIEPTLTDYYHIHPLVDNKTKDFVFTFSPKINGSYRIWVDVTPVATNKQLFLNADIGATTQNHTVDEEVKLNYSVNSYTFKLNLDGQAEVGKPIMATITVDNAGKPFNQLEPVMGAFAHLIGFYADYSSILHVHPMGNEPSKDTERGGPQLMFHIEPQKAGFVKLFAQFRIDGKDIYVPFGIIIK